MIAVTRQDALDHWSTFSSINRKTSEVDNPNSEAARYVNMLLRNYKRFALRAGHILSSSANHCSNSYVQNDRHVN